MMRDPLTPEQRKALRGKIAEGDRPVGTLTDDQAAEEWTFMPRARWTPAYVSAVKAAEAQGANVAVVQWTDLLHTVIRWTGQSDLAPPGAELIKAYRRIVQSQVGKLPALVALRDAKPGGRS